MSHDVFISYSTVDKQLADYLCNKLENKGIRAWYAPRDIVASAYAESIVNAINSTKIFVVIVGNVSSYSEHVLNEIALAFERIKEGMTIMPIKIDTSQMSSSCSYYLNRQHWLDGTTPPIETHLDSFAEKISIVLNNDSKETSKKTTKDDIDSNHKKIYQYANPKDQYHYDIGMIDISPTMLDRINYFLLEGEEHIKGVDNGNANPIQMAWIKSFASIIRENDPLGFSGSGSNEQSYSLIGDWHKARYTQHSSHDVKMIGLTQDNLNIERFGKYLGVIFGLQSGKAKVVLGRHLNPEYKKTSNYDNPLDKYIFEYGLVDISDETKNTIIDRLKNGHSHIESIARGKAGILQMAWIKSFEPIVHEIDSLGFSGSYSNEQSYSLVGYWHIARYTEHSSHDVEIMKLTDNDLNMERFGNYLAIIYSLLIGKARVVTNRITVK